MCHAIPANTCSCEVLTGETARDASSVVYSGQFPSMQMAARGAGAAGEGSGGEGAGDGGGDDEGVGGEGGDGSGMKHFPQVTWHALSQGSSLHLSTFSSSVPTPPLGPGSVLAQNAGFMSMHGGGGGEGLGGGGGEGVGGGEGDGDGGRCGGGGGDESGDCGGGDSRASLCLCSVARISWTTML